MSIQWLRELWAWCENLPRDMVFFFLLPFMVAIAGLIADECRRWLAQRRS